VNAPRPGDTLRYSTHFHGNAPDASRAICVTCTAADLLDAIDALHQPECPDPDNFPTHLECSCSREFMPVTWAECPTARLLHPGAEVQP